MLVDAAGLILDSNNVQRFSLDSNNNGFSLSSFFLLRMYFGIVDPSLKDMISAFKFLGY